MTQAETVDYGPLTDLIGVWRGDKGVDVAPEPDGAETSPYYETIAVSACGDVTNAEEQCLAVLHYRQIVSRKSDNVVFHDQTGYWLWDPAQQTVMHSFTIPRGVAVLAGGHYRGEKHDDGDTVINVEAGHNSDDWQIVQSPFMQQKARTTHFVQTLTVGKEKLSYCQTTDVEIYGKVFEHTDDNVLVREG